MKSAMARALASVAAGRVALCGAAPVSGSAFGWRVPCSFSKNSMQACSCQGSSWITPVAWNSRCSYSASAWRVLVASSISRSPGRASQARSLDWSRRPLKVRAISVSRFSTMATTRPPSAGSAAAMAASRAASAASQAPSGSRNAAPMAASAGRPSSRRAISSGSRCGASMLDASSRSAAMRSGGPSPAATRRATASRTSRNRKDLP